MPITPGGLGRGLYENIRDRVRQVMGPQDAAESGEGEGQGLAPDFWGRIRQTVQNIFGDGKPAQPPAPGQPPPPAGGAQPPPQAVGLSRQEILLRFQEAGRGRVLAFMLYNNVWRHVEPYSFRFRSRGPQPLMFGFCRIHGEIHSFRPDRVQGLIVTDEPYNPQWPVEF